MSRECLCVHMVTSSIKFTPEYSSYENLRTTLKIDRADDYGLCNNLSMMLSLIRESLINYIAAQTLPQCARYSHFLRLFINFM